MLASPPAVLRAELAALLRAPDPLGAKEILELAFALALHERAEDALVLMDAAETLRDRSSPAGQPHALTLRAWASAFLIDALAAILDPSQPDGVLTRPQPDTFRFTAPRWGEVVFRRSAKALEAHVEIVGEERLELTCGLASQR